MQIGDTVRPFFSPFLLGMQLNKHSILPTKLFLKHLILKLVQVFICSLAYRLINTHSDYLPDSILMRKFEIKWQFFGSLFYIERNKVLKLSTPL